MTTLAETVKLVNDPELRKEFTALPIERQMAMQEELLGKVIVDPDFQGLMQHDQSAAIGILHDFRNTLPVPPHAISPTEEALQTPGSDFTPTMLVSGGPDKYGPGVGPMINKAIDIGKTVLDPATLLEPGNVAGMAGAVRYMGAKAAPMLAPEVGGVKPLPLVTQERPMVTPTEPTPGGTGFPPPEPPKAYTRPPSGALPSELGEQRVNLQTTADVKTAAIENVQALGQTDSSEQGRRVMHQVVEALDKGMINVDRIPSILERSHLTMREFADELLKTYSTAGKQLQQLSIVKKKLNIWAEANPDAKEALAALDKSIPDGTIWDSIKTAYRAVDDPRRALMVGQLATAVRNFFSQGMRYGVEVLDEGLRQLYSGASPMKALDAGMQFIHSLKPSARVDLNKILQEFPLQNDILKGNLIGELTIPQKFLKLLNAPNIAQEQFYRAATFDAVLKNELRASKIDVGTALANPATIPERIIEKAVGDAMKVTFAAAPKEKSLGAAVMQAYNAIPMLTTVNPYPRFWANAAEFMATHNPLGALKLIRKDAEGEFLAANPKRRADILADATTGTMMLAGAVALQQAGARGGKWYQIQFGDQQIDLRAYAPFSNYMFFADVLDVTAQAGGQVVNGKTLMQALKDTGRYTTNDVIQGTLGINRIAGTGLIFTDMLTQGTLEKKLEMVGNFAAQYLGGFTVPIRTLKDAVSAFSAEEGKLRDVRDELLGPAKSNIPFVSQTLPEKPSPIENDIPITEHPVLRQLSGLSIKTANAVGTEMDRLGIEFSSVRSVSGNPELDRTVDRLTGGMVEQVIKPFIGSPGYQRINNPSVKRFVLESTLGYVRSQSRKEALASRPDLSAQEKAQGIQTKTRDLIESLTGMNLENLVKGKP